MTAIITALTDVTGLVSTVFGVITENPVLLFFTAAGLLPVGFGIFRMAKRAARK